MWSARAGFVLLALAIAVACGPAVARPVLASDAPPAPVPPAPTDDAVAAATRDLEAAQASGDAARVANAQLALAAAHAARGSHRTAVELGEKALAAFERLGDRAGAARALGSIAEGRLATGETSVAFERGRDAMKRFEAQGDRAGVARMLLVIGEASAALGNCASAFDSLERALQTFETLGDRRGAARALSRLGDVYAEFGDASKARALAERAIASFEAAGDREEAARALLVLSGVYEQSGDLEGALSMAERARSIYEARGLPGAAAAALRAVGRLSGLLGRHAEARDALARALTVLERLGDRMGMTRTLIDLGVSHARLGASAPAREALGRAIELARSNHAPHLLARALMELADVLLAAGLSANALAAAERAAQALEGLALGVADEPGVGVHSLHARLFDVGSRAAAASGDTAAALQFAEFGRAGALLETLGARRALDAAIVPHEFRAAEVAARAKEAEAAAAYRAAVAAGDDLAKVREAKAALDAAQTAHAQIVERIQRASKAAVTAFSPRAASLDQLAASLEPGDALVLYSLSDTEASALVVTRSGGRLVPLGRAEAITASVSALELSSRTTDPEPVLTAVRRLIVEPLGVPKDTKRLLVSPSGALFLVPFAALVDAMPVALVPSGTAYLVLREVESKRGDGVLAVGDPAFSGSSDTAGVKPRRAPSLLVPLPGTRVEAKAVGDVVLLGRDATESGLAAALATRPRWRAVHLATHGLVDVGRPTLSALALAPDAKDDGFLTAIDVLRMTIEADLVVLSASDTARGRIVRGEGLVGLTSAFLLAGAPRVIGALWKIDDQSTGALMRKFYALWNPKDGTPGLPAAEALRKAQEWMRSHEKWRHPYYWAAWVLWGLPS